MTLPFWQWGESYLRWLSQFERVLPFEQPSGLSRPEIAQRILDASDKTIASLTNLLKRAAVKAIKARHPSINDSVFA